MDQAALGSASIDVLALFGKTAFALAVVLGAIYLCSWVFKRFELGRRFPVNTQQRLRVVASTSLGAHERVVIVVVDDVQLVLGVTNAQITKLHELPAATQTKTIFEAALAAQRNKMAAATEPLL